MAGKLGQAVTRPLNEWCNAAGSAREELVQQVCQLVRTPAFFKRMLQSPSPHVRRSAYNFIATLSRRWSTDHLDRHGMHVPVKLWHTHLSHAMQSCHARLPPHCTACALSGQQVNITPAAASRTCGVKHEENCV